MGVPGNPAAAPASPSVASCLVPLLRDGEGELRVVLVRRAPHGIHGGQLAFPGGRWEPADADLFHTACREAWEEVGLPSESVSLLAVLPPITTLVSDFRVHPFLARIVPPPAWRPDPSEVSEVLEARLRDLSDPGAQGEEWFPWPGWPEPRRFAFIRIGPHKLWGATYRILEPLLPRLQSGEWEV
ncbi:MAG: CoA pyrophosphatase [Acidobacteriota bacterium]